MFKADPNKYLPQYGGFCAFGIYVGAKFRPDPNKFISKDGKYFLYLYNLELDAQQLWLNEKDHNKLEKTANEVFNIDVKLNDSGYGLLKVINFIVSVNLLKPTSIANWEGVL